VASPEQRDELPREQPELQRVSEPDARSGFSACRCSLSPEIMGRNKMKDKIR